MLALSLFLLLIGIIIGAIANSARLQPETWKCWRRGWLLLPAIGAVAALVGGWIGVLLIGEYLATGCALGVGVVAVVVIPGLAKLHTQ